MVIHVWFVPRIIGGYLALLSRLHELGQPVYKVVDGVDAGKVCLHLFVDTYAAAVGVQSLLNQLLQAGGILARLTAIRTYSAWKLCSPLSVVCDNLLLVPIFLCVSTFALVRI